jgi:hypothetical protein
VTLRTGLPPLVVVGTLLALVGGAVAQVGPRVRLTLEAVPAGRHSLQHERGRRVVVLFYEDRPHVHTNDALKQSVREWIDGNALGDQLVVYGAANLRRMPSYVPRAFVRSQIAPLAAQWRVPILLDWEGELQQDPWRLRGNQANVAVIDRGGHIVGRWTGPVRGARHEQFFATVRSALAGE